MRNTLLALLAATLMSLPARCEDLLTTLSGQEKQILEALKKKDLRQMQSLVEMSAWMVDGRGFASPAELALELPALNYKSFTISDARVMSLGPDSALLRYRLKQSGDFQGKPLPTQLFCTTAWVRKGTTWKSTFHQESAAR